MFSSPFHEPDALRVDAAGLPPTGDDAENESLRRTAVMMWLAESSPLSAAPANALDAVRLKVGLTGAAPLSSGRWRPRLIAASGWAVAACLAVFMWRGNELPGARTKNPLVFSPPAGSMGRPAKGKAPEKTHVLAEGNGTVMPLKDAETLREEIAGLRAKLKREEDSAPGVHRPVIHELTPPGGMLVASSQERMLDIIATALENDLHRRSGKNGQELVIESGWARWSASDLPADTTFRHRTFPSTRWTELGLLSGPGGQFFDPATGWLWSPDHGSSDYIGRAAPAQMDRSLFSGPDSPATPNIFAAESPPAGYAITGASGETIVALTNLPAVEAGGTLDIVGVNSAGNPVAFSVPLSANSFAAGWDFSGIIAPLSVDSQLSTTQGFGVRGTSITGATGMILQTGGPR